MKLRYKELVFSLSALLAIGCAKQSAPTGGPKDVDPPVALRSNPVNYSTNFKGKKFVVEFDEFIDLKNVNQELLVSPLLDKKPKVTMRGKKMVVRINNELADSTTYNFNFFNSVTDLNEGNVLENFQFEFSTGDTFDSTYVGGVLNDAFTGKPLDGVYVMLYRTFEDSTPRTQGPDCIGRTNKDGWFIVPNMKADVPYYMFALKDLNNNKKFDQPTEAIAFSDSTFQPSFQPYQMYDTIRLIKSISRDRKDTVYYDSIYPYTIMVTTIDNVRLNMFTEEYHTQYFHGAYRPSQRCFSLAFNDMLDSAFSMNPIIDTIFSENWCITEGVFPTDSVVFWVTDSNLYKHDTLLMQVSYTMKDTNNADYIQTDTVEFIFKSKASDKNDDGKKKKGGLMSRLKKDDSDKSKKVDKPKESELKLKHNINGTFGLIEPISLTANYPIDNYNVDNITLTRIDEKSQVPVDFTFTRSGKNVRDFFIDFKRDEDTKYELMIPANTLTDVYGNINDTIKQSFKTQTKDFYSTIILDIANVKSPSVVQLLNTKEEVLGEYSIKADTTLNITYLAPNKYKFKLFYDFNGNGKWDTGNFKERRQPESVFYFGETIETKSGWDFKYQWKIE